MAFIYSCVSEKMLIRIEDGIWSKGRKAPCLVRFNVASSKYTIKVGGINSIGSIQGTSTKAGSSG